LKLRARERPRPDSLFSTTRLTVISWVTASVGLQPGCMMKILEAKR
jgi:hypothetical protein